MENSSLTEIDEHVTVSSTTTSETVQQEVERILCVQKKLFDAIKNQQLGSPAGTAVLIGDLAETCSLLTDYALHLYSRTSNPVDFPSPSTPSTPSTPSSQLGPGPINSSNRVVPTPNYRSLFGDDSDSDSIETNAENQTEAPQQNQGHSGLGMPTLMEVDDFEATGHDEPRNIEGSGPKRLADNADTVPNKIKRNTRSSDIRGKCHKLNLK